MITGGLAAIIYGEPRLTNDVDIVLQLAPEAAGRLVAAFPAPAYYTPPVEVIKVEAARTADGHFNILDVDTALRADIYCLGDDQLGAWAMARRRRIMMAGESLWIAPIEYVILQKLRYYRMGSSDRHLGDITAMRRISGDTIDAAALAEWVERLGLDPVWRLTAREPRE